jgi:hypothetical protein
MTISHGVDDTNQQDYVQAQLTRTRQQVAEYVGLDGYHCTCYAVGASDTNTVRSERAHITVACMFTGGDTGLFQVNQH